MRETEKISAEQRGVELGKKSPNSVKDAVDHDSLIRANSLVSEFDKQIKDWSSIFPETVIKNIDSGTKKFMLDLAINLLPNINKVVANDILECVFLLGVKWTIPQRPPGVFSKSKNGINEDPIKLESVIKNIEKIAQSVGEINSLKLYDSELEVNACRAVQSLRGWATRLLALEDLWRHLERNESVSVKLLEEKFGDRVEAENTVNNLIDFLEKEKISLNENAHKWKNRYNSAMTEQIKRQSKN